MKGISYIVDNKNNKTAVVIDLKSVNRSAEQVEEMLKILMAESHEEEKTISFEI